jgi:hypothetical protein
VITPGPLGRLGMNVCITAVARLPHSLNGVFHPREISAPIITISTNNRMQMVEVRKHLKQKQVRELLVHYMEPSYLICTCCDWIAPVVESRLGLMNT